MKDHSLQTPQVIDKCPFCSSAHAHLTIDSSCSYVCCGNCDATGPMIIGENWQDGEKAIELWNKRTNQVNT